MDAIYIILLAVIVTTLINLFVISRRDKPNATLRRFSWLLAITGLTVLIVLTLFNQIL